MKTLLVALALTLTSLTVFAHDGGKISLAKAAELAAHRIDRLVALNKIDAGFLKKLDMVEAMAVVNADPVAYRAVVSQTMPTTGTPLQVEILSDHDGKPLSFKLLTGGTAGADPQWPDKDAGSLIENGMHYVLENNTTPMVAPYFNGFTSLRLAKGTLGAQTVATLVLKSSTQAQKLNIYLKLDGTFISAEVVP